jgi:AcrR family transcriptional regulator
MPRPKSDVDELLLTHAAEVIATEGVEAVSLRDVARRAGVSRAAPYHYFADKAEMVARVGALGFRRLGEHITEAASKHRDPVKQLRAGLLAYINFALSEPHFFHLMFSGILARPIDADDESLPAFSSLAARGAFELLPRAVQTAQERGVMRSGDPVLIANVFWAYAHGVAVLARGTHLKHVAGTNAIFAEGFRALINYYSKPREWQAGNAKHT